MTNKQISRTLRLLASLMELHGENSFKIRSYSNAAFNVNRHGIQLSELPTADIAKIKGVGNASAAKIESLLQTGSFPMLDNLVEKTPPGVLDIIKLKGLGAKKVKMLWEELGIESLGELLYACNENRLVTLKGFGAKTQENIRKSIEYIMANADKYYYAVLEDEAEELLERLTKITGVNQSSHTGAYRRKCEVIEAIELVAEIDNPTTLTQFCESEQIEVSSQTDEKIKAHSAVGTPLIIYPASSSNYHQRLFETTASAEHLHKLGTIDTAAGDETTIYKSAGLPYIAPELREGLTEIELAKQDALPELVKVSDINGVIHSHTTYSDGSNTLKDLATYCKNAGFEYLVVSDHSKSAFYANGLQPDTILQQQEEIDQLNQELAPFRIFKSIESDILYDGSLDYEEDVLASFDLVIASVHSILKMTEEKAMERLITAIENPYTTILGHMTGRLLLSREGYPVDHRKIIDACAANGVIIELNANPHRLDIDWRWIPYCMEKGVKISINPDAHSIEGVSDIKYGVFAARKGLLTKEMTFNTQPLEKIVAHFSKK